MLWAPEMKYFSFLLYLSSDRSVCAIYFQYLAKNMQNIDLHEKIVMVWWESMMICDLNESHLQAISVQTEKWLWFCNYAERYLKCTNYERKYTFATLGVEKKYYLAHLYSLNCCRP